MSVPVDGPVLVLRGGLPSWLVAGATPVVVVALVGQRLAADGLRQQEGEPVSPWFMVLVTLGLAAFVVVRALTQRADVHPDRVRSRNLLVTFQVDWADVERLEVVRRLGLVVVEVHVRHLRRRLRLGAATRFVGPESDELLGLLGSVPAARALLARPGPEVPGQDQGGGGRAP